MNLIAQITNLTPVSIPIGVLIGSIVVVVGALVAMTRVVVRGVWYLRGINDKLEAVVKSSWTRIEHERWAHRLEKENAEIGLKVPAVETESKH